MCAVVIHILLMGTDVWSRVYNPTYITKHVV